MRRRLIDLGGLISPDVGRLLFHDHDLTAWLTDLEPDWVLLRSVNERLMRNAILAHPAFHRTYQRREVFMSPDGQIAAEIYQRTGSVAEALEEIAQSAPPFEAEALDLARDQLRAANRVLDFTASTEMEQITTRNELTATWEPGEGLRLDAPEVDGYLWLPRVSVPAPMVCEIVVEIDLEVPTRQRGTILQIYWRGITAEGEGLTGMLEMPGRINAGPQRVHFPVGFHPDWLSLDRLQALRLDPGPPGTHALLTRVVLVTWGQDSP
jgi:hypothetical protein